MDSFEEIMGAAGDTPPTGSDAAGDSPALEASDAQATGADDFAAIMAGDEKTTDDSEKPATGEESAADSKDPAQADASDGKPEEAEGEEITDEAIDKALADGRSGKWFKNAVTYTRGRLSKAEEELQGYRIYGSREELEKMKLFRDELYGFEEKEGNLVSTVSRFAEKYVKEDPERGIDLVNALVNQDSPLNPGRSIFDELLAVPEVEEILKKRYSAPPDDDDPNLVYVPKDRIEAYKSISADVRADFQLLSESGRIALLEKAQRELDDQRRKDAEKEQKRQQDLKKYNDQVAETTRKNFDVATDEFYNSLKALPFAADPRLNKFLQSTVYDKVLTVVTMGETYAGKRAAADLADFGISVSPETAVLVKKLENDSKMITLAGWKNNQAAVDYYASEIATTQKQLAGRANEISAAISQALGNLSKQEAEKEAETLEETKDKTRPAVAGTGGGGGGGKDDRDYSRVSFEEILS